MSDRDKTKSGLIAELEALRIEVASLRSSQVLSSNGLPLSDPELTEAILDGIPDIIHLIDADGVYLGSIQTNSKDLIPKNINPIGKNITELLPLDIASAQIQAIQTAVATQQVQMLEQRAIVGDRLQYEEVRIVPIRSNAVLVIIRDISEQQAALHERNLAENALRESENRFRQIVQTQTDFLLQSRSDTTITFANESLCRALGVSPAHIVGQKWIDFANPDDIQGILENIAALTPENPSFYLENRDRRADGQLGWTQWLNQGIFNQQGQLIEIQSVGRDITVRKQTEDALRESQHLIEKIAATTPNLLYIYDHLEQRNVYMNRSVAEMLGYSEEDVQRMGASLFSTICHPDDLMRVYEAIAQCANLQDGEFIELEYRVRNARGEWRWLHSRDTVFSRSSDGRVKQTLGTSEDITDRKQREEMLENISLGTSAQTGEAFFRSLVQYLTKALNVEFAFVSEIVDLGNGWVKTVAAYGDGQFLDEFKYKLDGTPCETVLNKHLCIYPVKLQEIFPKDLTLTEMGVDSYAGTTLISSTGEALGLISVMSRSLIIDAQFTQEVLTIFAARASSELERQQAEEKLQLQYQRSQLFAEVTLKIRQSLRLEEILQTTVSEIQRILGASRAIVFQILPDGSGKVIEESVDASFMAIIGQNIIDRCFNESFIEQYRKGRVGAIADIETDRIQPCHAEFLRQFGVKANLVVPILQADHLWGLLIAHQCDRPRQWKNTETELLGQLASQLGIAIAQSQLIEDLRRSEEKYRHLIDNLHAGVVVHAPDTSVILCNSNACQLLGLTLNQIFGKTAIDPAWQFFREDGTVMPFEEYPVNQVLNTGQPLVNYVSRINRSDRTQVWVLVNAFPEFDLNHQIKQIAISFIDISDLKQVEEKLRKSESALAEAQRIAHVGNWHFELATGKVTWSREMFRIFGLDSEQPVPTLAELHELIHPDDRAYQQQILAEGIASKQPYEFECRIIHADGSVRYTLAQGEPIFNSQGELIHLFGTSQDISDRKAAEAALQQLNQELEDRVESRTEALRYSEQLLQLTIQNTPVGIGTLDLNGCFLTVNRELCQILGYSREELLQLSVIDITHANVRENAQVIFRQLATGEIASVEIEKQYIHKSGRVVDAISRAGLIKDSNGQPLLLVKSIEDVTERKRDEAQLRTSLQEKEVMLKEIHHRVKNNLQMISSLLSLQASYIDDRQMLALFAESQSRIKVMALIHEKLYRSDNLAKINFCEYLNDLVGDLLQSYHAVSNTAIAYRVDVANVDLGIELAIPCGLIVNELVSNAIKHAFPDRPTGEIWIQFSKSDRRETDYYLLSVGNNGVNFPQGIDFRNTESLGLQLVCGLTQQLRGKIELKNGEGCRFEILFPHLTQGLAT